MYGVIKRLTELLDPQKVSIMGIDISLVDTPIETRASTPSLSSVPPPHQGHGNSGNVDMAIKHDWLWSKLSKWLKANDILITEAGMPSVGVWDTKLPRDTTTISQMFWRSIGYTLPAAQGAALASRELGSVQRVILFITDRNFQSTAPAISTILKHKLDIIIFLINNGGYTIERWLHDMKAGYNDAPDWEYTAIPKTMGGKAMVDISNVHSGPYVHPAKMMTKRDRGYKSYTVNNMIELEELWVKEEFKKPMGMHFVEMHMRKEDAPLPLKLVCKNIVKTNKASST
ncbi:hypothetical protein LTS18_007388 [Coniosporium uncinatum]|uniref:Uncharacterized protein n=1 Tax=Coniosporium uncinatum TaxID=93489 RepID=A0ACC3DPD2_9PEZI|nr:hypothetical protein LTS18_007388 [Coniosporium uncinatum]